MNDMDSLRGVAEPLLAWYDRRRRVLPWREEPSPYRIWMSEIMLQQTRVEAVKPYYDRFLRELPDIAALASAGEEQLLKLWEGLGYYNRVRNMNRAARKVMEEYGGKIPSEYQDLLSLPGIGSYTAGAIASIAFGAKVPAVDGNVIRILSRFRQDSRDSSKQTVKAELGRDLMRIMPEGRPGDFNQALMELGAVVCLPNGMPKCTECPWEAGCMAHQNGRELDYPIRSKKAPRKIEEKTVLVICDENKVALRKRPPRGLLAGMYEFPSMEGIHTADEVLEELKAMRIQAVSIKPLPESKHIFTHKEWHMAGYMVKVDELSSSHEQGDRGMYDYVFVDMGRAEREYPIPSAYHAYSSWLNM